MCSLLLSSCCVAGPVGLHSGAFPCWASTSCKPGLTGAMHHAWAASRLLRPCVNPQVLWDVASGEAICGSPTHSDFVLCLRFFNGDSSKLVTAGNYNMHVWRYDATNNQLWSEPVKLGNLQRQFRSLELDAADSFCYAGTTSGDVMQVGPGGGGCSPSM